MSKLCNDICCADISVLGTWFRSWRDAAEQQTRAKALGKRNEMNEHHSCVQGVHVVEVRTRWSGCLRALRRLLTRLAGRVSWGSTSVLGWLHVTWYTTRHSSAHSSYSLVGWKACRSVKSLRHWFRQGSASRRSSQQTPSPTSSVQKLGGDSAFWRLEVK